MLYEQELIASNFNRCVIYGKIWTRDKRLVANIAQEALVYFKTRDEQSSVDIKKFYEALEDYKTFQSKL